MALASSEGWLFLLRWIHFFAGITWIGLLYYFNFVQTPFFAETEAPVRTGAIQKLVPRALWFVFVGWWFGFVWVLMAWSLLLLPYPMTDAIRSLLGNLPSVMTLAEPKGAA